jgi:hypothetical protein
MHYSTLLALSVLEAVVSAVPGRVDLRNPVAAAKCNKDNCYNVMLNTPSVAATFCSTFIQVIAVFSYTEPRAEAIFWVVMKEIVPVCAHVLALETAPSSRTLPSK